MRLKRKKTIFIHTNQPWITLFYIEKYLFMPNWRWVCAYPQFLRNVWRLNIRVVNSLKLVKSPIRNVRQIAHPLIGTSSLTLEIRILRLSEELVSRWGELSILSVIRKFFLIFIKIASVEKSYFDVTSIEGSEKIDAAFFLGPNEENLKRISTTNWKTLVRVFFDFIFCSMEICLIKKSFFNWRKI